MATNSLYVDYIIDNVCIISVFCGSDRKCLYSYSFFYVVFGFFVNVVAILFYGIKKCEYVCLN